MSISRIISNILQSQQSNSNIFFDMQLALEIQQCYYTFFDFSLSMWYIMLFMLHKTIEIKAFLINFFIAHCNSSDQLSISLLRSHRCKTFFQTFLEILQQQKNDHWFSFHIDKAYINH